MNTNILIRPAARGGKYLGPDAADANHSAIVGLLDPHTLEPIVATLVNAAPPADAGPPTLMNPVSRATPFATDATTVNAILSVNIDVPTTFALAVIGPLSHFSQARCTVTEITVLPGVNIGTSTQFPEGIVVEIPGLCISQVTATVSGREFSAQATVTMMCGCKISTTLPWPPSDFVIQLNTKTQSGAHQQYLLSYYQPTPSSPMSVFAGTWPNQSPGDTVVEAWISASEGKLGNQGVYWISGRGGESRSASMMEKMKKILR